MDLTDDQKKEVSDNWEFFESIHAELSKQPMLERKWIVVSKKSCVDITEHLEDAMERIAYNFPEKIVCIVNFSKDLKKCEMASTHYVTKKMFDFTSGFGPYKPSSVGVGYGDWEANVALGKESYPVKGIRYVNLPQTIVDGTRKSFGRFGEAPPKWVVLRLCTDSDKQYHGLYIGEVSNYKHLEYDEKKQEIIIAESGFSTNPTIYVPALNRCVFGCECWWKTVDDLKIEDGITDDQLAKTREFFSAMLRLASEKGQEKVTE